MGDKVKILEDLATLTKMCHAKSDGASLKIEEEEINLKIQDIKSEIEEVTTTSAEDNYDTSAEMADRNIEIITKKLIQTLKTDLKNKTNEMAKLKVTEEETSSNINTSKRTKKSYEKYISSMQDRITTSTDSDIITRYNSLIASTEVKIKKLNILLEKMNEEYNHIQEQINTLSKEIIKIKSTLEKKQEQLNEAQHNLENKDVYIDKAKAEKTNRRVTELKERIKKHEMRLEEIHKDPKYLEAKIKEVIALDDDTFNARNYLIELLSMSSKQPYMNVNADNALEEELLRATQARDSFANEIDQKTYDVMDTINPEQIRIEFLNNRINSWNEELTELNKKISIIDKDEQFHYEEKAQTLDELIEAIRVEVTDYKTAYENESEANLSAKATLKVALDEKKADLEAAEEIAGKFRKDEAEDIARASRMIKVECEELQNNIDKAKNEIEEIKTRLMSKKSGMKDIGSQNRDKEKLKELAKVVIDIKHRRQFPEQPIEIARRLEKNLGLDLVNAAFPSNSINNAKDISENKENLVNNEELKENEVNNELTIDSNINENNETTELPESIDISSLEETIPEPLTDINDENTKSNITLDEMLTSKNIKTASIEPETLDSNDKLASELDSYINNLSSTI